MRGQEVGITAILSIVALTLVFGAAGQVIPVGWLPQNEPLLDLIPHINAVVSLLAIGTIAAGWKQIRDDNVQSHKRLMIASFLLFAVFLVLYLYRVALLGPAEFPGPETIDTVLYTPFLAIHVLLAVICVPLLLYTLLLAATRSTPELRTSLHPTIGRVANTLWIISFAMGIVIYGLLYVLYG